MLTVDLDRLDLQPGHRVLDMGCGTGRHAFAAWRWGATVVALDASIGELGDVRAVVGGMLAGGELPGGAPGGAVRGDALTLPFADGTFDRIVAAEVLEHIWADDRAISELVRVLAPGGRIAVTVPAELPERICWALDAGYHSTPGGHIRVYRRGELEAKLDRGGLQRDGVDHAHALHSPYWWLRCAVGTHRADAVWAVRRYHDLLVWEISHRPRVLVALERALRPVLGKSLVLYAHKAVATSAAPSRLGRPTLGEEPANAVA